MDKYDVHFFVASWGLVSHCNPGKSLLDTSNAWIVAQRIRMEMLFHNIEIEFLFFDWTHFCNCIAMSQLDDFDVKLCDNEIFSQIFPTKKWKEPTKRLWLGMYCANALAF